MGYGLKPMRLPQFKGSMTSSEQLWYLVASIIAWRYYSDPGSQHPELLRRPSWSSVGLLRSLRPFRRLFVNGLLVLSGLLFLFDHLWLRMAYCLCVLLADYVSFAAYGGHTGFIFVYFAMALVVPDHQGALRWIVAHQLGAPAFNKLRIGGWRLDVEGS